VRGTGKLGDWQGSVRWRLRGPVRFGEASPNLEFILGDGTDADMKYSCEIVGINEHLSRQ
jgi:hypothetical protein